MLPLTRGVGAAPGLPGRRRQGLTLSEALSPSLVPVTPSPWRHWQPEAQASTLSGSLSLPDRIENVTVTAEVSRR